MWQHHRYPHAASSFLVIRHQTLDRDLHKVHRLSGPREAAQKDARVAAQRVRKGQYQQKEEGAQRA